MTTENFCFWLQGFFELTGGGDHPLSIVQAKTIKNHLALVFVHDIDPKAGSPEVQKKLNEIHEGAASTVWGSINPPTNLPPGVKMRC